MSVDKRITLYDNNGDPRWQTIDTTTSSQQSTAITANRILITSAVQTHFVAFGANPSAATTANTVCIPVGEMMFFDFVPGNKVAVKTLTSTGHISISVID
jgi:hypothetical protein